MHTNNEISTIHFHGKNYEVKWDKESGEVWYREVGSLGFVHIEKQLVKPQSMKEAEVIAIEMLKITGK